MSGNDTHADTIREALEDASIPLADAHAALDALVADLERERARADQAEAALVGTDEWVTRAATRADRAEAALAPFAQASREIGDLHEGTTFVLVSRYGPQAGVSTTITCDQLRAADAALSAGSGDTA